MSWIRDSTLSWFQQFSLKILKTGKIPKHVAIIMDGNRRYAKKVGVAKTEGHSIGFEKLAEALQWCVDLGVLEVTVYAFSIENFKRSKEEVNKLMELADKKFKLLLTEKNKLMERGVCVRVIGDLSLIPESTRKTIAKIMLITKDNKKAFINVAIAYTSRNEITNAVKDILKGVETGDIFPEDIDENLISKSLYTHNSPDPDLLIRTSGETRFSNFLVWQISNTCVYFADVLWPEFTIWNFIRALFYYQKCYSELSTAKGTGNSVIYNNRQSIYIDKLHNKRQVMLEEICLS